MEGEPIKRWDIDVLRPSIEALISSPDVRWAGDLRNIWARMPYAHSGGIQFGEYLKIAREIGKLSPEIDTAMAELLRTARETILHKYKIHLEDLFISKARESANQEPQEAQDVLTQYAQIAREGRIVKNKRDSGQELSEGENRSLEEFNNARAKLPRLANHYAPATFFLHFYDNGDLKWLWGVSDESTDNQIGTNSNGGRFGTMSGANHNW